MNHLGVSQRSEATTRTGASTASPRPGRGRACGRTPRSRCSGPAGDGLHSPSRLTGRRVSLPTHGQAPPTARPRPGGAPGAAAGGPLPPLPRRLRPPGPLPPTPWGNSFQMWPVGTRRGPAPAGEAGGAGENAEFLSPGQGRRARSTGRPPAPACAGTTQAAPTLATPQNRSPSPAPPCGAPASASLHAPGTSPRLSGALAKTEGRS